MNNQNSKSIIMKNFDGYILKQNPLRYEVSTEKLKEHKKMPLSVYMVKNKVKRCECGEKLILLYYMIKKEGIGSNREIQGKKCPCCGKNYFSEKSVELLMNVFDIVGIYEPMNSIQVQVPIEYKPQEYYMINREEDKCRKCGGQVERIRKKVKTVDEKNHSIAVKKCVDCDCLHMTYGTYTTYEYKNVIIINSNEIEKMKRTAELRHEIRRRKKELALMEKEFQVLIEEQLFEDKQNKIIENFWGNNCRVYVYFKLNNYCMRNKHNIQTVTMNVSNTKGDGSKNINIFYCEQCNSYWVNYEAIENMINEKFYPSLKYKIVNESWDKLKPVSELMLYGYNVREGELTTKQRHMLLATIIDKELMTKQQIIHNIQTKVDFNGKKSGNEHAREKWREDIRFVSHYTKGNVRTIQGDLDRRNI